jgi:antitoxin (DNA-binding transcriptional repressor) of toxin-antitoxin stability system
MTKVTIHAAKTNLSKLIAKVEAGEEITICRGDKAVAKLVAANDTKKVLPNRGFGNLKGVIEFHDTFFDPLPEEMLLPAPPKPKRSPRK